MDGWRCPCAPKYFSDAPNSSGLSDPCPSFEISAWVWMSIATSPSTLIGGVVMSVLRSLRGGDAIGLRLRADTGRPRLGDGVRGPAATGERDRRLLRVRPQREP